MPDELPIIERIYPIAEWRADPAGILRALAVEVAPQSAIRGSPHVTAYCEDDTGAPNSTSPTRIRVTLTWIPYRDAETP
jgi:hypothetical protein